MKAISLLLSSMVLLAAGQVAAAPVFVDEFSDTPATTVTATPGGTFNADTVLLLGGLTRNIKLVNNPGSTGLMVADANSYGSGFLSVAKGTGVTGRSELTYTGSALSGLTALTGTVSFSLLALDLAGMDVRLIVDGAERASLMDLPATASPTALSMSYAGNWSSGFTLRFEPVTNSDFAIDNLALVPVPGTLALLGLGLLAVAGAVRRQARA